MKRLTLCFLPVIVFVLLVGCADTGSETADIGGQDAAQAEIADIYAVIEALRNPREWVVIDARTEEEFNGRSRLPNAFGSGRIQGAVNVDRWAITCDDDNLLPREKLMEMFEFIAGRKVIVYCHAGKRSEFVQQALTELGFYALNYYGSWVDWSRAASVADGGTNETVLSFTEVWTDNEGEI